jgi:hypothetical protein
MRLALRTTRRILLLYAVLAVGTAFYPAFFGELPVPAEGAIRVLPDARPSKSRDELADVPTEFLPWSRAVADAYRAGRLPLRLEANGCGSPLWANPQAQAVTPTTLLNLFLPESWASAASASVKLALAASGAFVFLCSLGLSAAGAGWAGFAYGFSLHVTCWMHFPHTWPVSLLGWTLAAFLRVARGLEGGFAAALLTVFALLLGGYPEGEFYVAAATAIVFVAALLHARTGLRSGLARGATAVGASLLALGLTAVYNLPAAYALSGSERARLQDRGTLTATATPVTARDFARPPEYWDVSRFWVVPEAQGNPRDADKFGPYSFAGRASGYPGILIVAFVLSTFVWRRAPPAVRYARFGLVAVGLYVLWYPPLSHFLQSAPGIRQVAIRLTTNRANTIAVLLMALLAGFELDRLRGGGSTRASRLGVALAFLGVLAVTLEFARSAERPAATAWRLVSFLYPALLLCVVFVLLFRREAGRSRVLLWLILAATGVDLLRIGARFNSGTAPADYYPVTPFVQRLQRAAGQGRVAGSSVWLTGLSYMYGLEDVRVHDPVASSDYVDTLVAAAGYVGPGEYAPIVTRLDAPFLSTLNVRARFAGGADVTADREPVRPAFFPDRLVGAPDRAALLEHMRGIADLRRDAFAVGADEVFSGEASVLEFERPRPELLRIRVRTESPRVLLVAESDDGGWRARAGGHALPTVRIDGALLGVRVPAGETEIDCRYMPPGMRAGAWISAVSGAILLGVAVAAISRRP